MLADGGRASAGRDPSNRIAHCKGIPKRLERIAHMHKSIKDTRAYGTKTLEDASSKNV